MLDQANAQSRTLEEVIKDNNIHINKFKSREADLNSKLADYKTQIEFLNEEMLKTNNVNSIFQLTGKSGMIDSNNNRGEMWSDTKDNNQFIKSSDMRFDPKEYESLKQNQQDALMKTKTLEDENEKLKSKVEVYAISRPDAHTINEEYNGLKELKNRLALKLYMNLNTNSEILLEKLETIMSESKINQTNSESMLTRLRDAEVKMRELLNNSNELINKVTDSANLSMSKAQYDDESFNGDRF